MFSDKPFDDCTLPIKFDITVNDALFDGIINTGRDTTNEWFWELADFYTDFFDSLDINTFVDYEHQSKIDLFGPLITDALSSDDEKFAEDDYIVVDFHSDADITYDDINDIVDTIIKDIKDTDEEI